MKLWFWFCEFVFYIERAVYPCISDMKIIISLKKYSHCLKSREIVVGDGSKLGNYTSSRVFIGMMN